MCCCSENQIELGALHFCLLNLAGILTSRVCRAAFPQDLPFPGALPSARTWWFPWSWEEVTGGDVCGDGKGLIMMGSLTGNMGRASQRPSRWELESSAYLSPREICQTFG